MSADELPLRSLAYRIEKRIGHVLRRVREVADAIGPANEDGDACGEPKDQSVTATLSRCAEQLDLLSDQVIRLETTVGVGPETGNECEPECEDKPAPMTGKKMSRR